LSLALIGCAAPEPPPLSTAATPAGCGVPPAADGWATGTPESVGIDSALLCRLIPRIEASKVADIHSVLVVRHDKLVFEHYFAGEDERWGRPLGTVAYDATMLHDLRSVTKSVVSLVVGIAVERGWIRSLDTPVLDYFPEYAELRTPEKERITVRHLLTMSLGLAWNEDLPYSDPANSEIRMTKAPDPYRFVLEQPVEWPSGTVYTYSGGAPVLLSAILRKTSGKPLDELAREQLFEPLGITQAAWDRYANGDPIAASGLRLRPRDLVKIGELVLAHGNWHGRQIVPAAWIAAATTPQINGEGLFFYGYQFRLGRSLLDKREVDWVLGQGYGGQRLFIVPDLDLVVLVHAGLYQSPLQSAIPLAIFNRYALAATDPRK
jgi:CubicO group peptidase (beta-lactamase class C family)